MYLRQYSARRQHPSGLQTFSQNLHADEPDDSVILERLLSDADLLDTCREVSCGEEKIDRIMFRSSGEITLTPLSWHQPTEFVDPEGIDLSDHRPIAVDLSWSRR